MNIPLITCFGFRPIDNTHDDAVVHVERPIHDVVRKKHDDWVRQVRTVGKSAERVERRTRQY